MASVLVGIGCSLGESTILGFLKTFPCQAIGYYSSGTGLAGISGALIFMLLSASGLAYSAIFAIIAPTALIYMAIFVWLDR